MSKTTKDLPSISPSSTKKEMLEAYTQLAAMLENRAGQELLPEKIKEDRQKKETIKTADDLAGKGIAGHIDATKAAIIKELSGIAEKVETQAHAYLKIKEAIAAKERELNELFEIEKSAFALAALLEANKRRKEEFDEAMTRRREELDEEMETSRTAWAKEKAEYAEAMKEQKKDDEKRRQREAEEYQYSFNREKEQKVHALQDELAKLTKELTDKKSAYDLQAAVREKDLREREEAVADQEKRLHDLQRQVEGFPKELDSAVKKAVVDVTGKLTAEAAMNEELLRKTFEGEKNVLSTKIQAFEQAVAEQRKQIENLSSQLEKAYGKVQDIAVKAVSGSAQRATAMESINRSKQQQDA